MADINDRVSALEKDVVALQTEVRIQFKEVFTRIKRLETVLIATSGATIIMLLTILSRMG
jgi:broad specificity phosphatase PhoE